MIPEFFRVNPPYGVDRKYFSQGHKLWLLGHIFQSKGKLFLIVITTLAGILLQTIIPFLFGQIFDDAIPNQDLQLAQTLAIYIIILGVFRGLMTFVGSSLNEVIAQNTEMQIRIEFYDNLQSKNMSFFDSSRVGDLMSMASQDTRMINVAVSPGLRLIVSAVFGLIASGVAMYYANPLLSTIFLIISPLYIFFLYRFGHNLRPLSQERQEKVAKVNATLQENLTGVRVVRTFSGQEREKEAFGSDVDSLEDILIRRGIVSAFFIPSLLLGVATALIFAGGIFLISTDPAQDVFLFFGIAIPIDAITTGELITFLTLVGLLVFPTQILRWLIDATMQGFAGGERIFTVLKNDKEIELQSSKSIDVTEGRVEFDRINFSYPNTEQQVIRDVSFSVNPGETMALIGPTGCGKSTLGKLLLRLYELDSGEIRIDGQVISQVDPEQLRSNIGLIEQDTFLFSTDLRTNITYGLSYEPTQDEIEEAAKSAQAHDFITEDFEEGYDTIIGERGVTLSGGQKQRVSMARAFITNPKILIMDDSTSAIDAETESKIMSALGSLLKNRTTIIVTHRLSILKNADKIAFMRKGQIERLGTHEELIRSYQPYRQIFENYLDLPPIAGELSREVDN